MPPGRTGSRRSISGAIPGRPGQTSGRRAGWPRQFRRGRGTPPLTPPAGTTSPYGAVDDQVLWQMIAVDFPAVAANPLAGGCADSQPA
jgi:hypothetical protein